MKKIKNQYLRRFLIRNCIYYEFVAEVVRTNFAISNINEAYDRINSYGCRSDIFDETLTWVETKRGNSFWWDIHDKYVAYISKLRRYEYEGKF